MLRIFVWHYGPFPCVLTMCTTLFTRSNDPNMWTVLCSRQHTATFTVSIVNFTYGAHSLCFSKLIVTFVFVVGAYNWALSSRDPASI
jgi:hypothetical protein